jgi:phage tail-like protein
MKPNGRTFWILSGRNQWRTDAAAPAPRTGGVSATGTGLLLAADPKGPLSLLRPDGSLGGLVLPRRFALGRDGVIFLLGGADDPRLKQFSPSARTFIAVPSIGGKGRALGRFESPNNIAIGGAHLYVADTGNRRVQVFTLPSLALRHVWDECGSGWLPFDVAARGNWTYILDRQGGRVFEHRLGAEVLRRIELKDPAHPGHWRRIAVDRRGLIYLVSYDTEPYLAIYDRQGSPQPLLEPEEDTLALPATTQPKPIQPDAGPYRDRFDPPPIRLDEKGRFCLPEDATGPCGPVGAQAELDWEQPLGACSPFREGGLIFDGNGESVRVEPATATGRPLYLTWGAWVSGPLDSQVYRCQWHRITLELARLPVGTRLEVYTLATPGPALPDLALGCEHSNDCERVWDLCYTTAGATPSRRDRLPRQVGSCPHPDLPERKQAPRPDDAERYGPNEFLVQSREGRYLWIKVKMLGDGYTTPVVTSIRVDYPRASYLDYLPAIYSADDEGRRFLERFLSIFQTTWDDLNCEISNIARYFDPKAVPAGAPLAYLARWLALPWEGTWSDGQRRQLLMAAPRLSAARGTIAGLRQVLRVYLRNMVGAAADAIPAFPGLVEGFRERRRVALGAQELDRVGWVEEPEGSKPRTEHGTPLWSERAVGRLRLGSFEREGEARAVSTGVPGLDLYQERAHRFRVIVPSSWITTAAAEGMLRRAIEAEKPAHTEYDLCLVAASFRIGVQSTVGIDTIVGATPELRLASLDDLDAPPSRPPLHRLGDDTFLAATPSGGPELRLDSGARAGIDAVIS